MPRQYKSRLRAGQARQTRLAIVEAALALFLKNGYAETTLHAIAREAEVSDRTVYVAFKDKISILMAIADHAFYGATETGEKEKFVQSVAAVPRVAERLSLVIRQNAMAFEMGLAALARVVMSAVPGDPRLQRWVAEMIDLRHREWRMVAEVIIGRKLSPRRPAHERMVDELEAINSEEIYSILVVERAWPRSRYERFVLESNIAILKRYGFGVE